MRSVCFVGLALLTAAAVVLTAATVSGAKNHPTGTPDTSVTSWDAIGTQAFTAAALTPAEGHTIFAYVAIAVYDAVIAVEGGYEPFAVDLDAPAGASAEAAVAAAAHRVLAHYLPAQAPAILDPAYGASLATIPAGPAKRDGVAVGEEVAALLIEQRADDGFRAPVTYTPPNPPIPGVWLPTAPTPPIGTYLRVMRPFSLDAADQFRPHGPPALDSKRWAREYNEVKAIGSSTSAMRTPEQTLAARFWAEPPVQQARGSFRKFVLDHQLDVVAAARFMAMISVTYADALIACFDAKYHYAFWRPITAIRAGDTDDNQATVERSRPGLRYSARRTTRSTRAHTRASRRPGDTSSPDSWARSRSISPSPASPVSATATSPTSRIWSTRSATPASGAASTSAQQSRTGSRSARRPRTRCSPTTFTSRTTRTR